MGVDSTRGPRPLWRGRGRWLTVAAIAGFAGGVGMLRDAFTLLVQKGWGLGRDALFGWALAALGLAAILSANFVLARARWAWSVLMALGALSALLGLLVLAGRQPTGLVFLVAGAGVMLALWNGRAALGSASD